jgi:hypothetical protein
VLFYFLQFITPFLVSFSGNIVIRLLLQIVVNGDYPVISQRIFEMLAVLDAIFLAIFFEEIYRWIILKSWNNFHLKYIDLHEIVYGCLIATLLSGFVAPVYRDYFVRTPPDYEPDFDPVIFSSLYVQALLSLRDYIDQQNLHNVRIAFDEADPNLPTVMYAFFGQDCVLISANVRIPSQNITASYINNTANMVNFIVITDWDFAANPYFHTVSTNFTGSPYLFVDNPVMMIIKV